MPTFDGSFGYHKTAEELTEPENVTLLYCDGIQKQCYETCKSYEHPRA